MSPLRTLTRRLLHKQPSATATITVRAPAIAPAMAGMRLDNDDCEAEVDIPAVGEANEEDEELVTTMSLGDVSTMK